MQPLELLRRRPSAALAGTGTDADSGVCTSNSPASLSQTDLAELARLDPPSPASAQLSIERVLATVSSLPSKTPRRATEAATLLNQHSTRSPPEFNTCESHLSLHCRPMRLPPVDCDEPAYENCLALQAKLNSSSHSDVGPDRRLTGAHQLEADEDDYAASDLSSGSPDTNSSLGPQVSCPPNLMSRQPERPADEEQVFYLSTLVSFKFTTTNRLTLFYHIRHLVERSLRPNSFPVPSTGAQANCSRQARRGRRNADG